MHKNIICFLNFALFAICTYISPAVGEQSASKSKNCELVLGWHIWPPMQYFDEMNHPAGLQIELIKKLEKITSCNIKLLQQSFEKNQQAIKNGEIDVTFDITITEDRKHYGHFSIPYRKELLVLYVKPNYYKQCQEKDLKKLIQQGFRLSLTKGVNYGKLISDIQNDPILNEMLHYQDSNQTELELFKQGKLDGVLEDPIVMAYMKRNDFSLTLTKSCQITVYEGLVSIMFSKKTVHESIVNRFNKAINELKKRPAYEQLWGLQ